MLELQLVNGYFYNKRVLSLMYDNDQFAKIKSMKMVDCFKYGSNKAYLFDILSI